MWAVTQRDAVLVHVHGGHVAVLVRMDDGVLLAPGLPVVGRTIHRNLRWGMMGLDEGQDRTGVLIHGHAAAHESWTDLDLIAPGLAAVLAPPHLDAVPERQDRAVGGDRHCRKAVAREHLLHVHLRRTQERIERAFSRQFSSGLP